MSPEQMPDPDDFQDPLENYEPKTYSDPLEQALAEDTVGAIRHEPFATIPPEMLIHEAVEKLAGMHVACLLVAEDNKLVGIFSDRDVLDKVTLEYDKVKDQPVRTVMTDKPVYVHEEDSAAAALSVMAVSGYRHVPVLTASGELVGIVSPQRVTGFLQEHFEDD